MSRREVRTPTGASRGCRPSHTGWACFGLAVLVAAAAANTGANLLFAILALLVATLAVAWFRSRRALSGVEVDLFVPALVEAGRDFPGRAQVRGLTARTVCLRTSPPLVADAFLIRESRGRHGDDVVFAMAGLPRQVLRGVHLELETGWPFQLFRSRRTFALGLQIHVHPRLEPPRPIVAGWRRGGIAELSLAGEGGSLRELRPYVAGDNPRRVHWPTSARVGELMVRVDHEVASRELLLVVDTALPPGPRFEASLSRAASRGRDALRGGHAVELRAPGVRCRWSGASDLASLLRVFAGLRAAGEEREDGPAGIPETTWMRS